MVTFVIRSVKTILSPASRLIPLLVILMFILTSTVLLAVGAKSHQDETRDHNLSIVTDLISKSKLAWEKGEIGTSDSLVRLAMKEARLSYDDDNLLEVLNLMLEIGLDRRDESIQRIFPAAVEELLRTTHNDELRWRSLMNLGLFHSARFDYGKAYDLSYQAFILSEQMDDNKKKTLSLLNAGKGLLGTNRKMEAFRYYLNALYLARSLDDDDLLIACYSTLSRFYNLNKIHTKAVEYKKRELEVVRGRNATDSATILQIYLDLESIGFNSKDEVNEDALLNILHYAQRTKNQDLLSNSVSLFRSALISSGRIDRLHRFYHQEHPELLVLLEQNEPLTYIRLKAFFSEHLDQRDSADHFYELAAEQMIRQGNMILSSHFFLRYAEYLLRTERPGMAVEKALMSLDFARAASSLDYVLRSTELLQECYAATGNYEEALRYASKSRIISDSMDIIASSEDLLALELGNAERMRELEAQQLEEETRHRHNLQYTAIIIAILTLFLILMMIGSFRVPRWTIQALGFISFIFFFEFLILLADHKIHHMTHGEPWKILAIKIVLIAILLPFHHWIEKRVVHYLMRRKLIDISRISPGGLLRKLRPQKAPASSEGP